METGRRKGWKQERRKMCGTGTEGMKLQALLSIRSIGVARRCRRAQRCLDARLLLSGKSRTLRPAHACRWCMFARISKQLGKAGARQ
eukprot:2309978-Pleurochrysis_carterae.AAC.2